MNTAEVVALLHSDWQQCEAITRRGYQCARWSFDGSGTVQWVWLLAEVDGGTEEVEVLLCTQHQKGETIETKTYGSCRWSR